MERIKYLDGLRGIAILLVIVYHAFGGNGYNGVIHYGGSFSDILFFKFGYLGVQLFFLISRFVILMTLEKSKSFIHFMYKRWLRLFPAMLIATILIYTTARIFYERPAGIPNIYSVIPGLIFINPNVLEKITNIHFPIMEGAFWSLYVEMFFYVVFGLSYFLFRERKAIILLFCLFLYSVVGLFYPLKLSMLFIHFGWFTIGCLSYIYLIKNRSQNKLILYLSLALSLACLIVTYKVSIDIYKMNFSFIEFFVYGGTIISLFFIPIVFEKSRKIIGNRLFLFIGFISYPLYLIHENFMVSMISKLQIYNIMPEYLLPVFPVLLLIFVAYVITKRIEPFTKNLIVTCFDKIGILKYLNS